MALDALAITKWSATFLKTLEDAHVFKLGTNQDYQGDVKHSAAVKIFTDPEVTTSSYVRDDTVTYQRLTPGEQILTITERQYYAFKVDNLEKWLAMGAGTVWARAAKRGSFQLADDVDDFIRDAMAAGTPTANTLSARTIGGGLNDNAYDLIVDMNVMLDVANVPKDGRHVFVPPHFVGSLLKDERFVGFNTAEARKTIRGTPIGDVLDLQVHVSNNIAVSGSTYTIQAAWDGAFTYAEQLAETQVFEKFEASFDQGLREELVFGGKVVQPQGLVKAAVQFAS